MRATFLHQARDVRIETIADATIEQPTDALIRITRACICGSDLWPYNDMEPGSVPGGKPMGHEAIGVVEAVGKDVRRIKVGQVVIMPFAYSDGACQFCDEGLHTSCLHGGFFSMGGVGGAQAEALRVPFADGTLYPLAVGEDDALMPSLLTLSDVMGTGHHAAVTARVRAGHSVAVIGDGAVGLCGVIAAKRLGAERIIVMGRHEARTALARDFGATDVVATRGEEAIADVRQLTQGFGVHAVLECVGSAPSMTAALGIVRAGGAIGRVGMPHYDAVDLTGAFFYQNLTISGGPAPVRAYIDELLPDIMEGRIEPGRVFDSTIGLEQVPEGYRDMDARKALKVLIRP